MSDSNERFVVTNSPVCIENRVSEAVKAGHIAGLKQAKEIILNHQDALEKIDQAIAEMESQLSRSV